MNFEERKENVSLSLENHIRRTVSIPIMGNLIGVELEYSGDKSEIFKSKRSNERLNSNGWLLEN